MSWFAGDILYIENPKDDTRILLELINKSGKIAGYRINAHLVLGFCLFGINAQKSLAVFKTLWTIADQALLSIGF